MAAAPQATFILARDAEQAAGFVQLLSASHFLDTPIITTSKAKGSASQDPQQYGWVNFPASDGLQSLQGVTLSIHRHGSTRQLVVVVATAPAALTGAAATTLRRAAQAVHEGSAELPSSTTGAVTVCSVFFLGASPLPSAGQATDGASGTAFELADVRVTPLGGVTTTSIPDAGPAPILASMAADPSERWQWRRLLLSFTGRYISSLHPAWREEQPAVYVQEAEDAVDGHVAEWAAASFTALSGAWADASTVHVVREGEEDDDCATLAQRCAVVTGYAPDGEAPAEGVDGAVDAAWRLAYARTTAVDTVLWALQGNQGLWGGVKGEDEPGADHVLDAQRGAVRDALKRHRDGLWGADTGNGGVVDDEASEVVARRGGEEGLFDLLGGWVGILSILSTLVCLVFYFNAPQAAED